MQHLDKRLAEITDKRAADAARIHLGHVDAGIGKEATVHTDLAEFVLDQHQLFAGICLLDQLFDQRGLAGAQKAGKNINFGHFYAPLVAI